MANNITISVISKKYGLTQDTLRYYERIGLIPKIQKNKSGNRDYTENDCKWIEFTLCMRSSGIPIEILIKYFDLYQQGDSTLEKRKEILLEQRVQLVKRIEEMKKTLDRLDTKIERYEKRTDTYIG